MMIKPLSLSLLAALSFLLAPPSLAQLVGRASELPRPYSELSTLSGFQPSWLTSEASAKRVYDMLPSDIFSRRSGCYQRAHYWSHELSEHYGITSMKAFLFFTNRYRREFGYEWSFHVATLIPTRMNDGSIQDLVFDPVFVSPPSWASAQDRSKYDAKPISIHQWTRYFVYPQTDCPILNSYQEYLDHQDRSYCYIIKTPMFLYSPIDFDRDASGASGSHGSTWYDETLQVRTDWREGDIENMLKGLKDKN